MVQAWALSSDDFAVRRGSASARSVARPARKSRPSKAGSPYGWLGARAVFFLLAFALLLGGLSFVHSSASDESLAAPTDAERIVSVDAGDTLWGIAEAVKKDRLDTGEAVHRIMKRNALSSAALQSGQRLIIPASVLP